MPSTAIRQVLYDINSRRLTIVFQSGRKYVYSGVAPEVYVELKAAPSRGAYFNEWIRDRYPYTCVDADYIQSSQLQ